MARSLAVHVSESIVNHGAVQVTELLGGTTLGWLACPRVQSLCQKLPGVLCMGSLVGRSCPKMPGDEWDYCARAAQVQGGKGGSDAG